MDNRSQITTELDELSDTLRRLEILYEQYFSGVEKREPIKERDAVTLRIRRLVNRSVVQTDLRFRIASLSSRFHTYGQYWNRILRLMEEGRYHRGGTPHRLPQAPLEHPPEAELDRLHRQLKEAQAAGNVTGQVPTKTQLAQFLDKQKEAIQQKYGEQQFEFTVQTSDGKPKIVARRKHG